MLYQPIAQLHGINHLIAAGRASGERVFELLDAKIEVAESEQPVPMPAGPIHVQFHAASFQYPGRPSVIQNLDLELPPQKITAIVGQTGAGKSTIANLAMRAHDVTTGRIEICGTDIRSIQLECCTSILVSGTRTLIRGQRTRKFTIGPLKPQKLRWWRP